MKLKEIYRQYKPILQLYLLFAFLLIFTWFFTATALQFEGFSSTVENINKEVNSTFINGILTITAIVFGFISIEIRRVYQNLSSMLLIILPVISSLMLMASLYFTSSVLQGYPTVGTAFWVFVLFVSATTYSLGILFAVAIPRKQTP